MLRVNQLKLPLDHAEAALPEAICRRLKLQPQQLLSHRVLKRSIDARRQHDIQLTYSLEIELEPGLERRLLQRLRNDPRLQPAADDCYAMVHIAPAGLEPGTVPRPVVVGAGPCGYFCALLLAQMGWRPLLLERGQQVKQRTADTFGFWRQRQATISLLDAAFGNSIGAQALGRVTGVGHRGNALGIDLAQLGDHAENVV